MKLKKMTAVTALLALSAMTMAGCSPKAGKPIELTSTSCEIKEGETEQIYALTETAGKVTWKSSDESIVSVEDGKILGRKAGNATVTAVIGKDQTSCDVVVKRDEKDAVSLKAKDAGYYLEAGDKDGIQTRFVLCTEDENGNVTQEDATGLTYEMYNRQIAKVDENGVIKPLSVGPTTMTVTCGDYSCSVEVVVSTKLIKSTKDWLDVIQATDNLDAYYYVTKDLDFSGTAYRVPSGTEAVDAKKCFRGTIDGGLHKIKNVSAKSLFGPLMDAKITGLAFDGAKINGSGAFATAMGGNGLELTNLFVEVTYSGSASAKNLLADAVTGSGTMEQSMIRLHDKGAQISKAMDDKFTMKNVAVICDGKTTGNTPEGVRVFTSQMDAVWTINESRMLGSDWSYDINRLPTLGSR